MIPGPFEYHRATSLDDAIARLTAEGGRAKLLAGGHSLVPAMKFRLSQPEVLVDIARIPAFGEIREVDGRIEIGAGAVHDDVASSALLRTRCPAIAEAAAEIGDAQVRNRGTLGGSLAHADPAADYPAVVLALDAEILLRGPDGPRRVPASAFFRDLFSVDLGPAEIITGIRFTPVRAAAYAKLQQRASRFAIVGVAAALEAGPEGIRSARVGLTGASTHAVRLRNVEDTLVGKPASAEAVEAAARLAGTDLRDVNSDIHASEPYRRAMIQVFARRALLAALTRAAA
jgi:aerobic carbon-monoxide dehydrogenase medium subunit